MFGLFKKNPKKKLEKEVEKMYEQAIAYQRNGKIKEYGEISAQIEILNKKIEALEKEGK